GAPGKATIENIPEFKTKFNVNVNGKNIEASRYATVNGETQTGFYDIKQGDEVKVLDYNTAAQIAELMDITITENTVIIVNNERGDLNTPVYENFKIEFKDQEEMLLDYYSDLPDADEIAISQANEESYSSSDDDIRILEGEDGRLTLENISEEDLEKLHKQEQEPVRNILARDLHVFVNNEEITLHGKAEYIFVDIFDAIDFDLSRPNGRSIVTILNGATPDYMQPIKDGDKIEVYWKDNK
ncbi:MAG: cell division protein FtsA, partial [Butyrivibrio sp.]|nr:cell division protein FtsA [Butyrivibrio sp.]